MNESTQIQDMPADQISQLLQTDPWQLPLEQADSLCQFVARIGGPENAWAAAEMLKELEKNG